MNRKFLLIVFIFVCIISARKLSGLGPRLTIKYKFTVAKERNYCIECCKECFSESNRFNIETQTVKYFVSLLN